MIVEIDQEVYGDISGLDQIEDLVTFVAQNQGIPDHVSVSVAIMGDQHIAELNEQYRGKHGPTDVLSFECDGVEGGLELLKEAHVNNAENNSEVPFVLGDIAISIETAQRQAQEFDMRIEQEIAFLIIHGMLHLCGHDHVNEDEAVVMEDLERTLYETWFPGETLKR